MANERYGNNYLTCIGKEGSASYGIAENWEVALPDVCEIKKTIAAIDISQKTGTLEKNYREKLAGYQGGTVTISGNLNSASIVDATHGILLEALFMSASHPFSLPAVGTAPYSYTIYQYFNDDKGHIARGCVLNKLDISGTTGGVITYSAEFRPKTITMETSVSCSASDPFASASIYDILPNKFADVAVSIFGDEGDITSINSFSLSLNLIYADDAQIYQNSDTKGLEVLTGFEGSLTMEWNYDKTHNVDVQGKLMADELTHDQFGLFDSASTVCWKIDTYGKYTDVSQADPDKGIFTSSFTKELMTQDAADAIEITILTS